MRPLYHGVRTASRKLKPMTRLREQIQSKYLPRTLCSTTSQRRINKWMPYTVDVTISYERILDGWFHNYKKRVALVPESGLPDVRVIPARFEAVCVDTAAELPDEVRQNMPTILCLHGAGGSHEEFVPLLKSLVDDYGFRAVCLNWPGFGKTRGLRKRDEKIFQFRPEESLDFLDSFLRAIELNRLDMVVGHSVGCVAASYVSARAESPASLVLISPVPSRPFKGVQPYRLLQLLSELWKVSPLRPILKIIIQMGYTDRGMTSKDPMHAVNATLAVANIDFDLIDQLAFELEMKKVPKLFIYGGKDNFVEPSIQSEFAPKFGVKAGHFDVYNKDNLTVQKGTFPEDHYSKGVLFEEGGHVPHLKQDYVPILVKEIVSLFQYVQKKTTS